MAHAVRSFRPDDRRLTANHFSTAQMIVATNQLEYAINKQHAIL